MRERLLFERGESRGFDFARHVRHVCEDLTARLPELSHIDMSRVAISLSQTRKGGPYGIHASLTPMRFEGGLRTGKRRGRYYKSQVLTDEHGREILYILSFYLPRFMDVALREKLVTIVHELWHIGPKFDGDLRRFEGRCHAHTGSRDGYDQEMSQLVDRWLGHDPPQAIYAFLKHSFAELQRMHGRIYGVRYSRPKLLPIPAAEARRMNREMARRSSEAESR